MQYRQLFVERFYGLWAQYGVNPLIFWLIYVWAIPFFFLSVRWIVQNYKKKKPIFLPVLAASACFVSAYVYLIIVWKNVPVWVYVFVVGLLLYWGWWAYIKVKHQIEDVDDQQEK